MDLSTLCLLIFGFLANVLAFGPVPVDISNGLFDHYQAGYYYINISVGTPPQSVKLLLDTGSSNLWIYGTDFPETTIGRFHYDQSTTLGQSNLPPFSWAYGAGDYVFKGTFMTDTIRIGGAVLPKTTIGVVHQGSTVPTFAGILGLMNWYPDKNSDGIGTDYPTVLDALYHTGQIKRHAFSLYLDERAKPYGNVVFGAVDRAKFTGDLASFTIPAASGASVPLSEIAIRDESGVRTSISHYKTPYIALLDTGSPQRSNLPRATYDAIIHYVNKLGYFVNDPYVDCGLLNARGSIDLTFRDLLGNRASNPNYGSEMTVAVPISELAVPQLYLDGSFKQCVFGVVPGKDDRGVFSDNFIRSMYLLFALDYNTIGIAQSRLDVTETDYALVA